MPRIHPRSSSTNPGIPNQQLIKQAALAAVTAQAVAIQQQELCSLGPKVAPIIAGDGGSSLLPQHSVVASVTPATPINHTSTIIPISQQQQQAVSPSTMSSYANNLSLLPNHQNHHPQQSFIPGHLPQTMAPHPQQQAAAAAAALTQQQQATNPSSFVNFSTLLNQKDSRWLQLEVCREFQRNKCSRPDVECKFAHPGPAIEIQSGKVTACYDSIKVILQFVGILIVYYSLQSPLYFIILTSLSFITFQGRCNRDKPPCKYFHPPQHLKDQLLINGRNHLALKNALMQQVSLTTPALMPSHHTPSMVSFFFN